MKSHVNIYCVAAVLNLCFTVQNSAQGTWTKLPKSAPNGWLTNILVLSDGSVISSGWISSLNDANQWDKLTPDIHGSYLNGTWSKIAPMNDTRVFFASEVLKDGRVFVAGGEYGSGKTTAEVYNPLTNKWTKTPDAATTFSDASSEILEDGRVLVAEVIPGATTGTTIYNPVANKWSAGPTCLHPHNESSWVKLRDNSVLFVDKGAMSSERYIPSMGKWVADGNLPVALYDAMYECGPGMLLPDGRAIFFGGTNNTAIYTPSGSSSPGTWIKGPAIPNNLGCPDQSAVMMNTGKILCAFAPLSTGGQFQSPNYFYEYDYVSNTFTAVTAPGGGTSLNITADWSSMIGLPDGSVLFTTQGSSAYYIYTPSGPQLSIGKPTISGVTENSCNSYTITGTLFNGISEGSAFGDDAQMATNFPIIRLTQGTSVYYARSFNWNSTGVQRGNLADTVHFTIPASLPLSETYSLEVVANGISSDPVSFTPCNSANGIQAIANSDDFGLNIYPNPAADDVTLSFNSKGEEKFVIELYDVLGRIVLKESGESHEGNNTHAVQLNGFSKGIYSCILQQSDNACQEKLIIK